MNLIIVPLGRAGIEVITAWQYGPPYDLYAIRTPAAAGHHYCL